MDKTMVDQHMANGTPESRAMFARFVEILDSIGVYTIHPAKSTITFKATRRGFAGAHPKGQALVGYFDLMRRLDADPRVRSISPYMKSLFVHQFRVTALEQMNDEFRGWIAEAYGVGQGNHLVKKSS